MDLQSLANKLIKFNISNSNRVLAFIGAQPLLIDQIQDRKFEDKSLVGSKIELFKVLVVRLQLSQMEFSDLMVGCVFPE